jgi:hypothetical protein
LHFFCISNIGCHNNIDIFAIEIKNDSNYLRDLKAIIFPSVNLSSGVIVIPIMQHTSIDLVNYNADIEKDKCLEHFFSIAKKFQKKVESLGFWMDFIDPCSGLPMLTSDCNKPFDEVQSAQTLLSEKGFSVMNAGCCKILLHPK